MSFNSYWVSTHSIPALFDKRDNLNLLDKKRECFRPIEHYLMSEYPLPLFLWSLTCLFGPSSQQTDYRLSCIVHHLYHLFTLGEVRVSNNFLNISWRLKTKLIELEIAIPLEISKNNKLTELFLEIFVTEILFSILKFIIRN